jgi:hypothetical protein
MAIAQTVVASTILRPKKARSQSHYEPRTVDHHCIDVN